VGIDSVSGDYGNLGCLSRENLQFQATPRQGKESESGMDSATLKIMNMPGARTALLGGLLQLLDVDRCVRIDVSDSKR
jgi:hypothetical protein